MSSVRISLRDTLIQLLPDTLDIAFKHELKSSTKSIRYTSVQVSCVELDFPHAMSPMKSKL